MIFSKKTDLLNLFVLTISFFEYIPLRIVRKFFFSEKTLDVIGLYVPYYKVNNNRVNASNVALKFFEHIKNNFNLEKPEKLVVLEVGSGATNAIGYELASRGFRKIITYEPYMSFDQSADGLLLEETCNMHNLKKENILKKVTRINSLNELPKSTKFDIVISNHVLEHVTDPTNLFIQLTSMMNKKSIQIHFIGYIDHFFKYPYHLLMFNKKTWEQWLNPGNLPGWRLYDHIDILSKLGLHSKVLDIESDEEEFIKVKNYISSDYDKDNNYLEVNYCTLLIENI
ncbi:MAG: 2-polyprenyl-3-methyl-5-hydroxy-6-metoxy-1, 4-benzoquinol methylase [Parcubacteria group bacterium GW2011_GWD2_42_14]|nr:MAG: 2-polyprenyl-3-methyl-5-hydroxy-6-metoxy-1, 4-benzoquinol methylase [Parcubacteria group bacterium GW2011_GWD2_42_14]